MANCGNFVTFERALCKDREVEEIKAIKEPLGDVR
jgi:hypothetical protein